MPSEKRAMLAIKNILFPIDFSERDAAPLRLCTPWPNVSARGVTLMSVIQPFWRSACLGRPVGLRRSPVDHGRSSERDLEMRLDGALTREFAESEGGPGGGDRRSGRESSPSYARSEGVDLIMMPTHGYGPFRSLVAGFGNRQGAA